MNTVVVTGSARGIGKAIALRFAKAGYNVVINSRTTEDLGKETAQICQDLGVRAIYVKADLATEEGAKLLCDTAYNTFGKIDCLVNNAGVALSKLLIDCSKSDFDNVLINNLACPIFTSKQFLKHMTADGGCIINISSMLAKSNASMEALYAASKAGVIGLTQALACEYGPSGVRVNCIAPGFIETDMTSCFSNKDKLNFANDTPLGRLGQVDDIAGVALFLASNDAAFVNGATLFVDGGVTL